MTNHLFLFNLGPVQSFIEQARKTHDLYAGSRILAELTRVAAKEAIKHGVDLIFPAKVEDGSPIPNRFIGKIADKTASELQVIGREIEGAVTKHFKDLSDRALAASGAQGNSSFYAQIAQHWDINWLFYPIEGEGNTAYTNAYKAIEMEMQAVKNFRLIKQLPEAGRKCSLDGERNAMFFGKETNRRYLLPETQVVDEGPWIAGNEGLSAVSLVKRAYEKQKGKNSISFPSTAEIALLGVVSAENDLFQFYKNCVDSQEFEFQFCYKENITEKYLRKNGYGKILEKIQPIALEETRQRVFGNGELPKHYALVAFDGDNMGLIMSGARQYFKGEDLESYQRAVSSRLITFANTATQIFDKNREWGRIVYTGGDDLLGFVNLNHLFQVMTELRKTFHRIVSQSLREDGYFQDGANFNFSAGIALAHYKIPLSIVIHQAKEAEEKAKKSGRDAFAIAALKHSGESHTTAYPWALKDNLPYWTALEKLTYFLEKQIVSENFARVLAKSFYLFENEEGSIPVNQMILAEVKRTIIRAMSPDHKDKTDEVVDCVSQLISSTETPIKIDNFIEMMNIALYLKRVRKNKKQYNGTKN